MLADSEVQVVVTEAAFVDELASDARGIAGGDRSGSRRSRARTGLGRATARSGVCDLHVGFDRQAQGRVDQPSQRDALVRRDSPLVRLRRRRRVDAVSLVRVRFLGLGDVGRAAVRRPTGRRAVLGEPLATERFASWSCDEGVTVLNQTPSAFRQFIDADQALAPAAMALRYVIFGGEALRAARACGRGSSATATSQPQLVNMYGITETTVHVTYRPIALHDLDAGAGSVIGVPIPDLRLLVLDDARNNPCRSACPASSMSAAPACRAAT